MKNKKTRMFMKGIVACSLCLSMVVSVFATEGNVNTAENNNQNYIFIVSSQGKKYFQIFLPKIESNGVALRNKDKEIPVSIKFLEDKMDVEARISIFYFSNPKPLVLSPENEKNIKLAAKQAPTYISEDAKKYGTKLGYDPLVNITAIENRLEELTNGSSIDNIYFDVANSLIVAKDIYNNAYKKVLSSRKSITSQSLDIIIKERKLLEYKLDQLHKARIDYEGRAILYNALLKKYESSQKEVILDREKLVPSATLPFYNYYIKNPKIGKYEIKIENQNGKLLDRPFVFFVKDDNADTQNTKEILTNIFEEYNP